MGFLFLGKKDSKNAANETAAATRESARLSSLDSNYRAESAAQQMQLATAQQAASRNAADLLSKPMDTATVDLASEADNSTDDTDLLRRRRTTRQSYQTPRQSGLVV